MLLSAFAMFACTDVTAQAPKASISQSDNGSGAHGVQYPHHRSFTTRALKAFKALPKLQRQRLATHLDTVMLPLDEWLQDIARLHIGLICLGEDHQLTTRRQLALQLFPYLDVDVLFLEATEKQVLQALHRIELNQRAPVAGVDVGDVVRAATLRNPRLAIIGIDETAKQRKDRLARDVQCLRDDSMLTNLMRNLREGGRHALLVGAFHCADRSGWLYHSVCRPKQNVGLASYRNAYVVTDHSSGEVESLVQFLKSIGRDRGSFVIDDTSQLDQRIRRWFPLLMVTLRSYRSLIVLSETAGKN